MFISTPTDPCGKANILALLNYCYIKYQAQYLNAFLVHVKLKDYKLVFRIQLIIF